MLTLTAGKLMDIGAWDEVCEVKGWNVYCVNEGLMSSSDEVNISETELCACTSVRAYLRRIASDEAGA